MSSTRGYTDLAVTRRYQLTAGHRFTQSALVIRAIADHLPSDTMSSRVIAVCTSAASTAPARF
ncbi:MAG: hypothetical protein U0Q11_16625 [Vicinamibacterales bacterium]